MRTAVRAFVDRWLAPRCWSRFVVKVVGLAGIVLFVLGVDGLRSVAIGHGATVSGGVWIHLLDPQIRAVCLGLLVAAFTAAIWPLPGESTAFHVERTARVVDRVAALLAPEIGFLLILAALNRVTRAELYQAAYGEGHFVGAWRARYLFGPGFFALAFVTSRSALGRLSSYSHPRPGRDRGSAGPDVWRARLLTAVGHALLGVSVAVLVRCVTDLDDLTIGRSPTAVLAAWEALLLAFLVLRTAQRPPRTIAQSVVLIRRCAPSLALFVGIDALRVTSRADWYLATAWLSPQSRPLPGTVSFFTGHLYELHELASTTAMVFIAVLVWLGGPPRVRDGGRR